MKEEKEMHVRVTFYVIMIGCDDCIVYLQKKSAIQYFGKKCALFLEFVSWQNKEILESKKDFSV